MNNIERNWYTPEEVRNIVYDGLISIGTVRNMCLRGDIPCERLGSAINQDGKPRRRRMLIPASFVRKMQRKAEGELQ